MSKIKRILTGSRIDSMQMIYTLIQTEFILQETDTIDSEELFKTIMQKGLGHLNPRQVRDVLNTLKTKGQ